MENGNGWKIGCSIVLIIFNLILGAVFEPVAPVNAIFFLIAAVIFFYTLYKILSLVPKSEKQENTTTVWKNNVDDETTAALLKQIEAKEDDESEVRKAFVTKEKLEEYLKAEKDERIKPFIENCIKCYDILSDTSRFAHQYDHDHPDSEESQLYMKEWDIFREKIQAAQIKLGDENSQAADAYKKFSKLFDEDCNGQWIITTTISEYGGNKSFKNAPSFDRHLLFKYTSDNGCNYVGSYCGIPYLCLDMDIDHGCYFYPDYAVLCKDDNEKPSLSLEIIPYEKIEAKYLKELYLG